MGKKREKEIIGQIEAWSEGADKGQSWLSAAEWAAADYRHGKHGKWLGIMSSRKKKTMPNNED